MAAKLDQSHTAPYLKSTTATRSYHVFTQLIAFSDVQALTTG